MNKSVMSKNTASDVFFSYAVDAVSPEETSARHCHDDYEILYVSEGRGRYVIEGAEYEVKPGTVLFAPPFSYHSIEIDENTQFERYVLRFSLSNLSPAAQNFLESLCESLDGAGCYYDVNLFCGSIASVFERFEYGDSLPASERLEFRNLLTSELVLILSVATRESSSHDEGELGARVIKYLNEHIYRDISLDKLAKRFFVSKYYLCRAFKKHNGISVHGYINQKRVIYAKQLIELGESASSAAYKVGFGDYSAFYRAYIKLIGHSPTGKDSK